MSYKAKPYTPPVRIRQAPELTKLQWRILEFIRSYRAEEGVSPTFDEIGVGCGLNSKSNVSRHIRAMAARNAITFFPGRRRSIEVTQEYAMTVIFPPELWAPLVTYAQRAGCEPNHLLIEAFRDALPKLGERFPTPWNRAA